MTDTPNIVENHDIKGEVEDFLKGRPLKKRADPERIIAGLDAMLGKRADITSRVVAS